MDSHIRDRLKDYSVGIAGLGGLGSNVAVALARLGIGRLILVDFDRVEESNLNRQHYFIRQVGEKKTRALADVIRAIDPKVQLELRDLRLSKENIVGVFEEADIVVEALDDPGLKGSLVSQILAKTNKKIVAGSGIGGYSSSNTIKTKRVFKNLYMVGDGEESNLYLSPRVNIVAHHQANMVVRLIFGMEEV